MTASVNMAVVWLIAMIVLLVVEAIVPGLISIWFALGALAALIAAALHAPMWLQVTWFLEICTESLWSAGFLSSFILEIRGLPSF